MLSRLSPGRPQFKPSAAGHWELDPRSRSRGGYCSPAEQKRKGSGGESQQKAEPQSAAHLPPSITAEGRSRLLSRGQGDLPRFSSVPSPGPGHARSVSPVSPPALAESGGCGAFASLPVGSEKKEQLFQCLMESKHC